MESLPAYSTLEVAKHASAEDAWIIIGGKVLNVSTWLEEHPGGDVVLLDLAGRDATREFEDVGHSGDARARLDTLVIGTVRPATDEELRISRTGAPLNEWKIAGATTGEQPFSSWFENSLSARGVGLVGAAGAAVLGTLLVLRRYGVLGFPHEQR